MASDSMCPFDNQDGQPDKHGNIGIWRCPSLKADKNDTSMESETYECSVCGRRVILYYEDMA